MPRFATAVARCPRCKLQPARCICADLPRLTSPVSVVVVQHWKEARKPTSTGHLLGSVLTNCRIERYGDQDYAFDATAVEGPDTYLVFPPRDPPDALPTHAPQKIVLLDGTWSQASRMANRVPGVVGLPRLSFADEARPCVRLRVPHLPEARSTIEAAASAFRWLGDPETAAALESIHDLYVRHTMAQRGMPLLPIIGD